MGSIVGAASGFLGSFMILKRMALVGDALTHVALPGIGLAIILGINPFFGAFALLFVAIILIWYLEHRTEIPIETLVGIFFAASLAIGVLLIPALELYEALFGDISNVGLWDGIFAVITAMAVFSVMMIISKRLLVGILSRDLAVSMGINMYLFDFLFLILVAVVVALGVKVVGSLLMGGLVVIPAAAAKNISGSFRRFTFLSSLFGLFSGGIGIYTAKLFSFSPGPAVVLVSAAFFLISLALKRH